MPTMPTRLSLTKAVGDQLADAVAQGVPIQTAARAASIAPETVYTWLHAARDGHWPQSHGSPIKPQHLPRLARFAQQIATAQAAWEAQHIKAIVEYAAAYNERTGLRDWRARAWLLNNHPTTRDRYRQEHQKLVTVSGTVHHELSLAQAADDRALEQWAALELPAGE
jgi:transposase-like protein